MRSLSETVATLEARKSNLSRELATVEARLEAISKALEGQRAKKGNSTHAEAKGSNDRPSRARVSRAKATTKRVWFEKNEIGKLLRKAARTPTPVADVVRELAKMKGYVGSLSTDDMRRFQGAAFMAVAQGVKSKVLRRRADGTVVAA
jgi:chromosome segregation ATPase